MKYGFIIYQLYIPIVMVIWYVMFNVLFSMEINATSVSGLELVTNHHDL